MLCCVSQANEHTNNKQRCINIGKPEQCVDRDENQPGVHLPSQAAHARRTQHSHSHAHGHTHAHSSPPTAKRQRMRYTPQHAHTLFIRFSVLVCVLFVLFICVWCVCVCSHPTSMSVVPTVSANIEDTIEVSHQPIKPVYVLLSLCVWSFLCVLSRFLFLSLCCCFFAWLFIPRMCVVWIYYNNCTPRVLPNRLSCSSLNMLLL